MTPKEIISLISIGLGVITALPYWIGIYKRETKPHMFSWVIWATVCGIAAAVQLAEGGGAGSWYFMFNATGCIVIAIVSYWLGTKDVTRSDAIVFAIAMSAIPVWVLTDNPLWSLFILIGIDGIAYIPTIRKSWNNPYEEKAFTWGMSAVVFATSIAALESYTLTTWLYPFIFIVINLALTTLLVLRRRVVPADMRLEQG